MMSTFIAQRIEAAYDKSAAAGQAKYRAYFVKTKIYARYKNDCDAILEADDYADAIVTE